MSVLPPHLSAFSKNSHTKAINPKTTDDAHYTPCPEPGGFGDVFYQLTSRDNHQSSATQSALSLHTAASDVITLQVPSVQQSPQKTETYRPKKSAPKELTIDEMNYLFDTFSTMTQEQYKLLVRLWQDVTNASANKRVFVLNEQIKTQLPPRLIQLIVQDPDLLTDVNTVLNSNPLNKKSKKRPI